MDQPPPPTVAASPSTVSLVALTQTYKRRGKPLLRFADVESEILAVLATDPATWSPAALKSETLVYLIRWLWHVARRCPPPVELEHTTLQLTLRDKLAVRTDLVAHQDAEA